MANLTDADKVIRNDVGKSIVSKLDDIADAIVAQGGGAHSLGQLSDVDIDTQTLAAGQIIEYDDNDGKWKNVANPASTTNFGADYDENTTYNTGDKCVYNNLLYECNDDGVTGAWDATKWDSLTVASMTDNNLPHYTGTPTAGSTAEAIGAKVDNSVSTVYINAVTNVSQTLGSYSRKMGKLVNLCHNFKITTAAAPGTTIATLQSSANYPSANSNAFCFYGSNGTTWLVAIDTSGNIKANNNMPVGEYVLFGYYPTA